MSKSLIFQCDFTCRENFEGESPFHPGEQILNSSEESTDNENEACDKQTSSDNFQNETSDIFSNFIKEIQVCSTLFYQKSLCF